MSSEADFTIGLYSGQELVDCGDAVWDLLMLADKEYIPPLSARESTTTLRLDQASAWTGPVNYFADMMNNQVLLAHVRGRVVALLSFVPHYEEEFLAPFNPCTYVTTSIGRLTHRQTEIRDALNEALEGLDEAVASPYIARRTWSTNVEQVEYLTDNGFKEAARIKDNRGPGIDTIYFVREAGSSLGYANRRPTDTDEPPNRYVWD